MGQVGKWRQSSVHATTNVAKQRTAQLKRVDVFAQEIEPNTLYAAFASAMERGSRYYWLLRTQSKAYKLMQGLKVAGATLRKGSWVIDARCPLVFVHFRHPGPEGLHSPL